MTIEKTQAQTHKSIDGAFLEIMKSLRDHTRTTSTEGVSTILTIASGYVSDRAAQALKDFYALYFGDTAIQKEKQEMNRNVDELFDQVKEMVGGGSSSAEIEKKLKESDTSKNRRLSLSGLQKELESIIRLDEGMKQKMLPILSQMQFDDMLQHRLSNIVRILVVLTSKDIGGDAASNSQVHEELMAHVTSNSERELFYQTILHKPYVSDPSESEIWFDALTSEQ